MSNDPKDNGTSPTEEESSEECEKAIANEASTSGRKLCKTLDAVDSGIRGNLYKAVRESLHKVNRVSKSSLPPIKRRNSDGDRPGVSLESCVGRFSAIKALFEQEPTVKPPNFNMKSTTMSRIVKHLDLKSQKFCHKDLESEPVERDINDNMLLK